MLLGVLTFNEQSAVAMYPLVIGGVSLLASIVGTFAVRSRSGNVERALYQGLIVSGVLAAAAFYPITKWLMDGVNFKAGTSPISKIIRGSGGVPPATDLRLCTLD